MFSPVYRRAAVAQAVQTVQVRNAQTLSQIKARQLATQSIAKITGAMKMVATSKLRGAREQIAISTAMYKDIASTMDEPEKIEENEAGHKGDLFVIISSDRGLCGGFNNNLLRPVRPIMREAKQGDGARIISIGEKGRAALDREFKSNFDETFVEVSKVKKLTFRQVARCAESINKSKFLTGRVVYSEFINTVVSQVDMIKFFPVDILTRNTELTAKFENEGDDEVYTNLWEYVNATRLYYACAHSFASETSARMGAMSTSSRNAGDMFTKLKQLYNRRRQAKITGELSEIISGAAAAEDMV